MENGHVRNDGRDAPGRLVDESVGIITARQIALARIILWWVALRFTHPTAPNPGSPMPQVFR